MPEILAWIHRKWLSSWALIRQMSGDDAYDRYLAHQASCHPGQPVLNRKEFFQRRLTRKWQGISRCC